MGNENLSIYYHVNNRGGWDKVALGNARTAARIARLPLSTGRKRGYGVHVESIGRLVWCSPCHTGGTHLHGYVSRRWATEHGIDC